MPNCFQNNLPVIFPHQSHHFFEYTCSTVDRARFEVSFKFFENQAVELRTLNPSFSITLVAMSVVKRSVDTPEAIDSKPLTE